MANIVGNTSLIKPLVGGVKRISLMTGYKDVAIYTPAMLLFIEKGGNDDL